MSHTPPNVVRHSMKFAALVASKVDLRVEIPSRSGDFLHLDSELKVRSKRLSLCHSQTSRGHGGSTGCQLRLQSTARSESECKFNKDLSQEPLRPFDYHVSMWLYRELAQHFCLGKGLMLVLGYHGICLKESLIFLGCSVVCGCWCYRCKPSRPCRTTLAPPQCPALVSSDELANNNGGQIA